MADATDTTATSTPTVMQTVTGWLSNTLSGASTWLAGWLSALTGWRKWAAIAACVALAMAHFGLVPSFSSLTKLFGSSEPVATAAQVEDLQSEMAELRANVAGNAAGLQSLMDSVAAKDDVAGLQARLAKAEAALKSGVTTSSVRRKR